MLIEPQQRGTDAPLANIEALLGRFPASSTFLATHWMVSLCVLGQYGDAFRISEYARPFIFHVNSMASNVPDYVFFRGLAAAVLAAGDRGAQHRRYQRVLRASQRQLALWARHGPDFVHMDAMLRAERGRLRGQQARTLSEYEAAAERAQLQGYVHHCALIHERSALLLRELGETERAKHALRKATELYAAWGARAKLAQLEADTAAKG